MYGCFESACKMTKGMDSDVDEVVHAVHMKMGSDTMM